MTDLNRAKDFINNLEITNLKPDELAHFGVLGMHWGVRKSGGSGGAQGDRSYPDKKAGRLDLLTVGRPGSRIPIVSVRTKPKTPSKVTFQNTDNGDITKKKYPSKSSHDHVQSRELKAKPKHELTNTDIDKIVNRLQKEQSLKRLDPSAVDRGKTVVLGTIAAMGAITAIHKFVNGPIGRQAVANGKRIVDNLFANGAAVKTVGTAITLLT